MQENLLLPRPIVRPLIFMANVKVCTVSDIKEGKPKLVSVNGKRAMIVKIGKNFHCIGAVCTHKGGPLNEGFIEDNTVQCPWHGGKFNLETGKVESPPPTEDVPAYKVEIKGDYVYVKA